AHVSTAGSVALLRDAKARGLPVTAEVTPHHLFLTEEVVSGYGTHAKMVPPLRTSRDVEALRGALADGTIDALATDHAPHHYDEKEVEFEQAADRKSTRLNSSHQIISYAVFCLTKKQ